MNYTSADGIIRLNRSGVTTGIYGGATQSATCNFDLTGRATTCSNTTIAYTETDPKWSGNASLVVYASTVVTSIRTNISSGLGMNYTSADGIIRLNQSGATAGIYGGANQSATCAFDLTGRATTCSNTTLGGINAGTMINAGTLPDARLSTNVPLEDGANVFTNAAGNNFTQINLTANGRVTTYVINGCTTTANSTGVYFTC
jgi:hypothetical protein